MRKHLRTPVDYFDLFELMGAKDFSDQEKTQLVQGLTEVGLEKFFYDQLGEITDNRVIMKLRQLAAEKAEQQQFLTVLRDYNPHFEQELVTSIQESKKKYLLDYFNQIITSLLEKKELFEAKNVATEKLTPLNDLIQKYKRAEELTTREEWRSLVKFWKS